MNYFIDTEFLEGTQKEKFPISLFRKNTPPTIDLISIGIVSEDGREYYAVSKDFNLREAWDRHDEKECYGIGDCQNRDFRGNCARKEKCDTIKVYWLRENVLKPIWIDFFLWYESEFTMLKGKAYDHLKLELESGKHDKLFTFKSFKALVNRYGKTNEQIAEEVKNFCGDIDSRVRSFKKGNSFDPVFYAYYADYDWVAFCWLFGKMMDLPTGYPMYCRDLKQMLDEKPVEFKVETFQYEGKYIVGVDPYYKSWEDHADYPEQENEHNALADAIWNKKLYDFLKSF